MTVYQMEQRVAFQDGQIHKRLYYRMSVEVSTALATFPGEFFLVPVTWVHGHFPNIVQIIEMPRGGHFAAMEEPELLAKDVSGDGRLQVKFKQLSSPFSSRDFNADCCDGQVAPRCRRVCLPKFKICYKGGTSSGSCLQTIETGFYNPIIQPVSSLVIFTDNDGTFNFSVNASAPDQHYIQVEVIDTSLKLIDIIDISAASSLISQTSDFTGSRATLPITLTVEWQLFCDKNWYDNDCGEYCVVQDTAIPPAHYTCNTTTGQRICLAGYENSDRNCSTEINECESTPCQNGATCHDDLRRYSCQCPNYYTGGHCETAIFCSSSPCENNGTCQDLTNSYKCTCHRDYTGTNCETHIDDCASYPCQNGGQCNDGTLSYQCDCKDGYTGIHCETGTNWNLNANSFEMHS
ncbi:delta-like protein B [Corticium candelabrum]|uniref:delta-like protein B n=1 Tax=Corticium candelabrum TaxID=121492 RepID=UPI002E26DED1|nr:delta-like protein B [Corticium candelabrum]